MAAQDAPALVNSTVEDLQILRGRIDTTGTGTILQGSGFTITANAAGDLTVTFTTAFSDVPTVTLTAEDTVNPLVAQHGGTPTTTTCEAWVYDPTTGVLTDGIFHFHAIGPR